MNRKDETERTIVAATGVFFSVAGMILSIYLWDRPTELAFRASTGSPWHSLADAIGIIGLPAPYVAFVALALLFWCIVLVNTGFVIVERILPNRATFILLCAVTPWLAAHGLQGAFGRSRPRLYFDHGIYAFHPFDFGADYSSFPSSHAAVSAAMATAFSLFFPDYRITFFPIAIIVAASRIAAGYHYLSDTIAGILLGILIVAIFEWGFGQLGIELRRRPKWPPPVLP